MIFFFNLDITSSLNKPQIHKIGNMFLNFKILFEKTKIGCNFLNKTTNKKIKEVCVQSKNI